MHVLLFLFNVAVLEIYASEYVSHRLPDRFILMRETIHGMNYHYSEHPHTCGKASPRYKK